MISRRRLLASGLAVPAACVGCDQARPSGSATRPGGAPVATFVSTPDLFNGDVGDLTTLPTWDGGPNSINESWELAIDKCLGALASHDPQAVLVAGDLVEGRWNLDTTDRRLFGEVSQGTDADSLRRCREAITAAGGVYYGHYREMFRSRGLRLLPAVGDHELMDDRSGPLNDRWSPGGRILAGQHEGEPDNRYYLVPHAKAVWADHFTKTRGGHPRFGMRPTRSAAESTAYAVDIGPKLRVITVDVFTRTPGGVRLGVFGKQLEWVRRTVRAAKRQGRVVVVQGHIPLIAPYRTLATGNLHAPEGRNSPLYRALVDEGADFYFSGEVHDTTVIRPHARGPVQISHGSIFRYAFNFLVGQVFADGTTELDYYEMSVTKASHARTLWSTDEAKWQRTELEYGDPIHRGRLLYRSGKVLQRTEKLGHYDPAEDDWKYEGNLHPELV